MGAFVHWLSIEELSKLDAHKLALLKAAIEREIAKSDEFQKLLKDRMKPVYDSLVSGPSPSGGGGSSPGAALPPGTATPGTGSGSSGAGTGSSSQTDDS